MLFKAMVLAVASSNTHAGAKQQTYAASDQLSSLMSARKKPHKIMCTYVHLGAQDTGVFGMGARVLPPPPHVVSSLVPALRLPAVACSGSVPGLPPRSTRAGSSPYGVSCSVEHRVPSRLCAQPQSFVAAYVATAGS
jgi:hypothetical protein